MRAVLWGGDVIEKAHSQAEQVQQIPIDALHPFINHPFKVLDDEAMTRTVESLAQYGVLAPLIARPRPEGDGYEIISGHRRQYAAKLAGLDTLPVIVRQMDDDAAVILMVDSNLQREHILPSKRALAYKMKLDAMRRTSGRPSKENPRQLVGNFETADIVGKESGESGRQVQRFIRLTNLVPELLDMVDEKKIAFNPAVELSYLDESQQRDFLEAMEDTQNAPSLSQAQQLKKIRFRTLGIGYGEDEIKAVLEGKAKHHPYQKQSPKEQPFQLLVDIQGKIAAGKNVSYKKWATKFNLKEMSKTLLFLQEQKIGSAEELRERAAAATERYHAMGDSIKAAEARLTEIAVLKTHIINYAKTREVYAAYRKAGYSKAFLEAHREGITLHKAAKAAFDEAGLQKLPKVKELDAEFAELLTKKKAAYPEYRKARNEMQELVRAQKNVERFFVEEKDTTEKTQTR